MVELIASIMGIIVGSTTIITVLYKCCKKVIDKNKKPSNKLVDYITMGGPSSSLSQDYRVYERDGVEYRRNDVSGGEAIID